MATVLTPSTAVPNNTYAGGPITTTVLDADGFLMKRDFLKAVDTSWDDKDFVSFPELTNTRLVQASSFYHYEQGLLFRAPYIGAASGTPAAATTSFTLSAASYYNNGVAVQSPLKVTDNVHLIGDIYARVSAVSGSGTSTIYTITRRTGSSDDLGTAIAAHITAAAPIAIQFDSHAERSGFPGQGMSTPATRFSGAFQTIKSFSAISGDADAILRDITVDGQNYQFKIETTQMLKRHRIKQNMAFMFSPEGAFADDAGAPVPLTASLRGKLKSLGNKLLYDSTAGFVLADLDKLCTQIKLLTGDTEVHWFIGPELRASVEAIVRTFTVNGGISYNSFGNGNNQKRAVDLGFDSFTYHGITFHMQEFRLHSQLTGLSWQTYGKEGYILPASAMSVTRADNKNGVETVTLNALTLCYKMQSGGQNRRFREVSRGMDTTFIDQEEKGLMTQEGLQYVGARKGWFIAPGS